MVVVTLVIPVCDGSPSQTFFLLLFHSEYFWRGRAVEVKDAAPLLPWSFVFGWR